jgi:predicted NodU family carbamoyl transferase
MLTLGVNYSQSHNSSACIVRDGGLQSAVAEERISHLKHDARSPSNAIRARLDFTAIRADQLVEVCFGWLTPGYLQASPCDREQEECTQILGNRTWTTNLTRTIFCFGMNALVIGSFLVEK